MCVVKTPKVDPQSTKAPDPAIIRNPLLDGLDPVSKALRLGRSSLRIERAGSKVQPTSPATASTQALATGITPVLPKLTPVRGGVGAA